MPLLSILLGFPNMLPILREVVDCSGHMKEGGQKDALFVGNRIAPPLQQAGPRNCYLYLFDGASNEQGAGRNFAAVMPWGTLYHASEHVLGLIFQKISDIGS